MDSVQLSDGSIVRRLPHPTVLSSDPPRARSPAFDNPFRLVPSTSTTAPSGLFSASYSVGPSHHQQQPSLSRTDSHPLSFASSSARRRSSSSDDNEPAFGPSRRLSFEDDEEVEARSPLQPSHAFQSTPVHRLSPSSSPGQPRGSATGASVSSGGRKRSPFLTPLSISPSRRLSPKSGKTGAGASSAFAGDTSVGGFGSGWRELSPARSPGGAEEGTPSKGASSLARRGTLSAVAGGLRRMSVRVVNVTGAAEDDEGEEAQAKAAGDLSALSQSQGSTGLMRTPSGMRRRRSSAMTLAERRASRAAGVPSAFDFGKSVAEEDETVEGAAEGSDEGKEGGEGLGKEAGVEEEKWEKAHEKSERAYRQLRGKTLGIFGPDNPLRKGCAMVLTSPWTEPIILLLIILQVVVLTIQAAPNVYDHPRPTKGYFHSWEDYILFAIFVFFTVEIAARILVTGLIFNPPLPEGLPPPPKTQLYSNEGPNRTPSIVTRIQSRLSPHPSPLNSPLRSPSATGRFPFPPSPTRAVFPHSPSTSTLHAVPLSPIKDPGTYPPASRAADPRPSTDITSLASSRYGLGVPSSHDLHDDRNASSVSLVRDNSHAPLGIGLGLSARNDGSTSPTSENAYSLRTAFASTLTAAAGPASSSTATAAATSSTYGPTSILPQNFSGRYASQTPYALSIARQRQTYQQAFLRHSWNRIDAVAILSFWISFALAQKGWEAEKELWFFRAVSVLRATRLLAVTQGTQTILQSLKKASPLLVDVGLFVAFAMVLFAIIGVQAFRGSFRRTCQWIDPDGLLSNVTASDQHCGGFVDPVSGNHTGYLLSNYQDSGESPKGYICGAPSVCVETDNPAGGTWSFDNIFAALMQVFVVASANTWTDSMYSMMDADYFVSCLFFICCLVVVNYWLFSLFVACITSTFADIRDETKHSAFSKTSIVPQTTKFDDDRKPRRGLARTTSILRKIYDKTSFIWILAIICSVGAQAASEFDTLPHMLLILSRVELGLTFAFDLEIVIRVVSSLPDWRTFFDEKTNKVDLALAVITSVIQIPAIAESRAYPWMSCFQIARFYRVILFIPRMRRLLVRVLGTFTGLINMIFFLLLMNFIAALIAVQLLRGIPDPDSDDTGVLDWYQIYNSFLAMYQILSSENWTTVIQTALSSTRGQVQIVITAIFLCGWMFFSFFILGNLFIAVLSENFHIAEEEKRARQAEAFVNAGARPGQTKTAGWFRRFDPYNYVTARRKSTMSPVTTPVSTEQPQLVEEPGEISPPDRNLTASPEQMDEFPLDEKAPPQSAGASSTRFLHRAQKSIRFQSGIDSVVNYVDPQTPEVDRSRYRHPRDGTTRSREATMQEQVRFQEVEQSRRNEIADFLAEHPSYDKTLFLFSQASPIRQFCQSLVDPCFGTERINGRPPVLKRKRIFSGIMLVAIVASIAVAGIATPLYRRDYYLAHGSPRFSWFNIVEASLGFTFFAEFVVKTVADGFLWTPNAYLLSIWNDIDFFVLVTLVINVSTSLAGGTASSAFTRALKAFRALRLINLSSSMRATFYNVLIVGAGRIMDASILAGLYIIPFAVWGENVFSGLLFYCTDSSVLTKAECAGEYLVETVEGWAYLAPRVWTNPYVWSFDSFKSALLILFEIISLEGWIDVMESVMTINGRDRQPQTNAQAWNALFFVGYNLVGATFILTLFVSLIIQNFAERTSASLLTTEQRQWLDLRRYINRQRPAKRPRRRPTSRIRAWCFDRAVSKHGWWSRSVTVLYCVNIVVLMTQSSTTSAADDARNYVFLGFTLLYAIDILVRIAGLGRIFFAAGWNLYDLVVVLGTFGTTLPILAGVDSQSVVQLQKLFLVSICLKLAQRNDSLNQLFKTAAASLPAILNIFALWLVLFLVWAIFFIEIFGLTRWGSAGTPNANYYTFFNAMVLLALQSTGEGWNEFMHNYTIEFPSCTFSTNYLFNDCGSAPGAYALFITWNILSMYLFVNLLLGAVIENFSFVHQAYGKVTTIDREQMRDYKKLWAQFDTERTGYLQPKDVGRFLHRLTTVFEVKIYREEWSPTNLLAGARRDPTYEHNSPAFVRYLADRDALSLKRVDLDKLESLLEGIDIEEVRQRREIFIHVYHEAKMEAEKSVKGISFATMLTLIAHYRLIDDDMALQMDELVKRRQQQELVVQRVSTDKVHSFLLMTVLRRRYLNLRQASRRQDMGAPVPAINIVQEGSPSPVQSRTATPKASPPTPVRARTGAAGGGDEGEAQGDESVLETPSRSRPSVSFAPGAAGPRGGG
ncbi:hypothetical protein JCM8547_004796 [Rhodosporidiobolus lusitaniae]